jgi:hypothetical protein
MGMLKEVYFIDTSFSFFCPVFKVWFINVWQIMGEGKFRTTDTNIEVYFRDLFTITMPNTEGKYIDAQMLMLLSPTAEYCLKDPGIYTPGSDENPVDTLTEGEWVLIAVIWYVPEVGDYLPIGPASCLTLSKGI